jgi:hypothetical protein
VHRTVGVAVPSIDHLLGHLAMSGEGVYYRP